MTVATTTSRVEYAGNGSTTAFSVPFYFLANGDLKVYQGGALKTITTHYTVSGAGNPAGGTVTFVTAPASTDDVVIFRDPALTQGVDYVANDPFPAESHEQALDRLTMITQRNRDLIDRSFVLPDGVTGVDTTLPEPEANKVISWDSTGTALQNRDATDFATALTYSDRRVETFTGDGATVDFVLANTPAVIANTDVDIEGVSQVPGVDYQLLADGVTLRFDAAPANGLTVVVKYGQAVAQDFGTAAIVTYAPAGTGAVATTVQAKLRESVSVKDFGAVGDGVTDNSAALQAALDYAGTKAIYGETVGVYIPNGVYNFASTIYVRSYTLLHGPGTLLYSGAGKAVWLKDSGTPVGTQARDINLRDFTLKTTNALAQVGIFGQNVIRIIFESITVLGDIDTAYGSARWTTAGIQIDTAAPYNSFLLNFSNCKISRTIANAIYFSGDMGNSIVNIEGCSIAANDGRAIYQPSPAGNNPTANMRIVGNEIEGNSGIFIEIGYALGLEIADNHFEHSTGALQPIVKVGYDVYAVNVSIHNNGFGGSSSSTPYHVTVNSLSNSEISNNIFSQVAAAINISSSGATNCQIARNQLTAPTVLFAGSSESYFKQSVLQTNVIKYTGSGTTTGPTTNINGSLTGSVTVKPGSGTQFQSNSGGVWSAASVGDTYLNSSPTAGGYMGWTCVYAGRIHYQTTGNLTSGSNVIASVAATFDWSIGDLICTDTEALGVPAGTTVTNVGANTLTISANATANGTGVNLYGARFKGFGLIEA